jgi:hypothetical protein
MGFNSSAGVSKGYADANPWEQPNAQAAPKAMAPPPAPAGAVKPVAGGKKDEDDGWGEWYVLRRLFGDETHFVSGDLCVYCDTMEPARCWTARWRVFIHVYVVCILASYTLFAWCVFLLTDFFADFGQIFESATNVPRRCFLKVRFPLPSSILVLTSKRRHRAQSEFLP